MSEVIFSSVKNLSLIHISMCIRDRGITAIISVKLKEAQFEGQTKAKLGNTEVRTMVDKLVS